MVTWSGTIIFHDNDSRPYQDFVGDTLKLNIVAGGNVQEDANWLLTGFYRGLEPSRGVISRGAIFTGTNLLSPPAHCSFMFLEIGKDATLNHPQLELWMQYSKDSNIYLLNLGYICTTLKQDCTQCSVLLTKSAVKICNPALAILATCKNYHRQVSSMCHSVYA